MEKKTMQALMMVVALGSSLAMGTARAVDRCEVASQKKATRAAKCGAVCDRKAAARPAFDHDGCQARCKAKFDDAIAHLQEKGICQTISQTHTEALLSICPVCGFPAIRALPELVIDAVWPRDSQGFCGASTNYYEVRNSGRMNAGGFYVVKTCVGGSGIAPAYRYVSGLGAGQVTWVPFPNNCTGWDTLTVDFYNQVAEMNESNNSTSSTRLGCYVIY